MVAEFKMVVETFKTHLIQRFAIKRLKSDCVAKQRNIATHWTPNFKVRTTFRHAASRNFGIENVAAITVDYSQKQENCSRARGNLNSKQNQSNK
jgi:hypothetical protein